MGVIDDHERLAPLAPVALHPAGHRPGLAEALQQPGQRHRQSHQGPQGGEQVAGVEAPEERAREDALAHRRHDLHAHALGPDLQAAGAHPGPGLVAEAVAEGFGPGRQAPQDRRAEGVVQVHDRGPQALELEQAQLRLAVGLQVAVVIQVVAGQVGEDRHVEGNAAHPPLVECVGGHLHGHVAHPPAPEVGQEPVHGDGVGGGVAARVKLAEDAVAERPEDAAGLAAERRPVRGQGLGDQVAHRGLAVRPGDAGHPEVRRRVAEEAVRHQPHAPLQVGDPDDGHPRALGHRRDQGLLDHGAGPAGERVVDEPPAVGGAAGQGEEQVSRAHLPAVEGEPGDLGATLRQLHQAAQQGGEARWRRLHRCRHL